MNKIKDSERFNTVIYSGILPLPDTPRRNPTKRGRACTGDDYTAVGAIVVVLWKLIECI